MLYALLWGFLENKENFCQLFLMFRQLKTPWYIKHNDAKVEEIDLFISNFNTANKIGGIEISVTLEADDLQVW